MPNDYEREFRHIDENWRTHNTYEARLRLARQYAWAIPCDEALEVIGRYGPIVEGGAGSGYWAKLLRDQGVDVVAYDAAPYENHWVSARWTEVLVGDHEAMAQHKDRALLLIWPPYDEPMGLDHIKAHGGTTVILVGEGPHGCTGDRDMHKYLEEHFEERESVDIPQWESIHDWLRVYVRKVK